MTTISILLLGACCVLAYAGIEFVLLCLEAVFATAKFFICWLISRPCSWKNSFLGIRIIFTWMLSKGSFAELSPKQIYKHHEAISSYMHHLVIQQGQRKDKFIKKFHPAKSNQRKHNPTEKRTRK